MTAFKNTIVGRILRGVGKVALVGGAVAGAVVTGGALAGTIPKVVSGVGLLGKLKGAGQKVTTGISKVAKSAVNLVTGTTKAEREQVGMIKAESKAAQDKLDQIERLVNAGATLARARELVGVTAAELGSADAEEKDRDAAWQAQSKEFISAGYAPGSEAARAGPSCLVTLLALIGSLGSIAFSLFLFFKYLV
jgi:hypothetical protein